MWTRRQGRSRGICIDSTHLLKGALCSPIPTFIMRFFTFGSCSYHVYCKLWLAASAASVPTATISKEKQFGTLSLAARSVAALLSIILYSCVIELAPPRRPSVMIITPADFCGILSTATIVNRGHVGRFLFAFLRPTRFNVTGKRRARFFASASSRHVFRHQLRQSGC